jgi:hypothetical protein
MQRVGQMGERFHSQVGCVPRWICPHANNMTSEPIRDPVTDHLLTPANAALLIIDYQPPQVDHIGSTDRQLLLDNIVRVARLGVTYGLPVVLSTVNVATGVSSPTIPELKKVLAQSEELGRTTINALSCELQRDWSRTTTAQPFREIVFGPPMARAAKAA